MKIVENLSALALRQLIDAASKTAGGEPANSIDAIRRQFTLHPDRLRTALAQALDNAWWALEIALAGKAWWEQCRGRLRPDEEADWGPKVRAFLEAAPLGDLGGISPDQRRHCLRELHSGRQSGLLTGEIDRSEELSWLDRLAAPDAQGTGVEARLVEQVAEEIRHGFGALAEFLMARPLDGRSPLTRAVQLFFRRAVTADPELAPSVAGLPPLAPPLKTALDALADVLARHAGRVDGLLALAAMPAAYWGRALDIEAETRDAAEPLPSLGRLVLRGLQGHPFDTRPLNPGDFLATAGDDQRKRTQELAARIHALSESQQRKLPALLCGLALLEAAAGFTDEAQSDLMTAVGEVSDPRVRACLCFNAYRVALEQHNWQGALALLQQAVTLDAESHLPFPQDKFEPERIIGCELAGVAFLCKHRASGTRVMVRSLWDHALAQDVPDLFREARVLEELDNPLLVRLRDGDYADEARQRPYLVTDAFEGATLADYLRQHGPLPPADLMRVVQPIAEVLQAAHERGVLHRYLKPGSVLVRKEGNHWRVKLINFGLAPRPEVLFRAVAGPAAWSRTTLGGSFLIAFSYLAPEQLGLIPGAPVGPAADVYSFGRLCYFALLGTPEPDDEEKESLPPAWRKLLGKCTSRSPARRPSSFQGVLRRLAQLTAGGTEAPAPSPAAAAVRSDVEVLQNYINRGMLFRQQGNLDRALAAFTKALQIDPKLLAGYIKRGNVYLDKGDYDRAVADYTSALRIDPENTVAYMNRGLAHTKKGAYEAAIADCTEAVKRDPKMTVAYSIRAAALWERGERHRAIADYNLALRNDPKNALAYNGRGLAYADQGEYDRAISDYSQAVRNEPRLVVAYVNRGNAFHAKKQFDAAVQDFTQALRLDPRHVIAHYNRALTLVARQSYDEAIDDFTKVLQLDPRHPEAAARRDEAQRARSAAPAGRPAPRPAATAAVGQRPVRGRPGMAPKRRAPEVPSAPPRPVPSAAEQAEEERRQMRAAAYFASGRSAFDQDNYDQALEHFTRALQVDPKDPLIYYHRGLAHVARDDFAEALADFTESIRLNPKNALAHYQRGIAHRLLGRHDPAIQDYTQALRLDPRLALAYRNRSLAYAAKGDTEQARADYDRALRLDPSLARDD